MYEILFDLKIQCFMATLIENLTGHSLGVEEERKNHII